MSISQPTRLQADILTIFPEVIDVYARTSILGRAQEQDYLCVKAHNLRNWANDTHHKVDDVPYGGGPGMVMKVEPFDLALQSIRRKKVRTRVILTSASGQLFTHQDACRLATYDQLIFLCGRYEGIDHRVEEFLVDETFSIGEYVLTGGELPALVMLDAVARQIPGVLGDADSLTDESHGTEGVLEYPQYTKPEHYGSWSVPEVLLSGHHARIREWRKNASEQRTTQMQKKEPPV